MRLFCRKAGQAADTDRKDGRKYEVLLLWQEQ